MALRLRRGTNAERATRVFDLAEPVWVTDKQQLWIGNGTGSVDPIQSYAGTGLSYSYNSTNGGRLSVNLGALNTDQLPQGGTNKYFSNQQAQDAFAELLSNGTQTGITFTYNPVSHALDVSIALEAFLVASDTNPSLGGNLDLDTYDINGTGNVDISGDLISNNGNFVSNSTTNGELIVNGSLFKTDGSYFNFGEADDYNRLRLTGLVNASDGPILQFVAQRGTLALPAPAQVGDYLAQIRWGMRGVVPGGSQQYPDLIIMSTIVDEVSDGVSTYPRGTFEVLASNGPSPSNAKKFQFTKHGVLSSQIFRAEPFANATARDTALPTGVVQAGMIIFLSSTSKLQINTNGTTAGWVDIN